MITPEQSRAGRGLLGWSQQQLANNAGVGLSTVRDFEKGRRTPTAGNADAIRAALEAAGVVFVEPNGLGPGVRLRQGEQ